MLTTLLTGLTPDFVKDAVAIFYKNFQTDSENGQVVREFEKDVQQKKQTVWEKEQEQLTERDNIKSDYDQDNTQVKIDRLAWREEIRILEDKHV